MNFLIRYFDPDELLADAAAQFERGGFLVRLDELPEGLLRDDEVTLSICFGELQAVLACQVLQLLPGHGVALCFESSAPLEGLLASANTGNAAGPGSSLARAPAEHSFTQSAAALGATPTPSAPKGRDDDEDPPAPAEGDLNSEGKDGPEEPSVPPRPKGPNRATKIRMARYGDLPDREAILKDTDRSLQRFVITNPGLTLVEVKRIAGRSTTLPQTLKTIAERREWASRPEIALAILRNPRSPVPVAISVIPHVGKGELRTLLRTGGLRTPILNAARKLQR